MPADYLMHHTELYFRTLVHTVFPLHAALVDAMCKAPRVPLELATVLEDIGQGYCRLAEEVNAELKRRGELRNEPNGEDTAEVRINDFVERIIAGLGHIEFYDGQVIDACKAVGAHPIAADALRAAILIEKGAMPEQSSPGEPAAAPGDNHGSIPHFLET